MPATAAGTLGSTPLTCCVTPPPSLPLGGVSVACMHARMYQQTLAARGPVWQHSLRPLPLISEIEAYTGPRKHAHRCCQNLLPSNSTRACLVHRCLWYNSKHTNRLPAPDTAAQASDPAPHLRRAATQVGLGDKAFGKLVKQSHPSQKRTLYPRGTASSCCQHTQCCKLRCSAPLHCHSSALWVRSGRLLLTQQQAAQARRARRWVHNTLLFFARC